MKVKIFGSEWEIQTLLIRWQCSYSKAKVRRITPNTRNIKSSISLDFHVYSTWYGKTKGDK